MVIQLPSSTAKTGCMYRTCSYHRITPGRSNGEGAECARAVLNNLCTMEYINIPTCHTKRCKYGEHLQTHKWLRCILRYTVFTSGSRPLLTLFWSIYIFFQDTATCDICKWLNGLDTFQGTWCLCLALEPLLMPFWLIYIFFKALPHDIHKLSDVHGHSWMAYSLVLNT